MKRLAIWLLVTLSHAAGAAPRTPDPTFGVGGVAATTFGTFVDPVTGTPFESHATRVLALPDGKLLAMAAQRTANFCVSASECSAVEALPRTDPNYAGYVYEARQAFLALMPDTKSGACPAGANAVYRAWNARVDSNHRYTVDRSIRDAMVGQGWIAEGYGPDAVAMCTAP